MGIIYIVTNNINSKSYIGKTTRTLEIRKQRHYSDSKYKANNRHFLLALLKYNPIVFEWDILEVVEDSRLNEAEVFWIAYFKYIHADLYNMTRGGDGGRTWDFKLSAEKRQQMALSSRGRKQSAETLLKLSKIRKGKGAKTYTLVSSEGVVTTIINMLEFCKQHKLDSSHMIKVYKGKINRYKGWTRVIGDYYTKS